MAEVCLLWKYLEELRWGTFSMVSSGNGALQSLQPLIFRRTRIKLSFWGGCYALLSGVLLLATPWREEPGELQSTGFFRHGYWSGLPFPSAGDLCHLVSCGSCIGRRILYPWANWEMLAKHKSHVRMDSFMSGPDFWHGKLSRAHFSSWNWVGFFRIHLLSGSEFLLGSHLVGVYWLRTDSRAACGRRPLVVTYGWDGACKGLVNTARFLLQSEGPVKGTENW